MLIILLMLVPTTEIHSELREHSVGSYRSKQHHLNYDQILLVKNLKFQELLEITFLISISV